jgi:hypothetical protein
MPYELTEIQYIDIDVDFMITGQIHIVIFHIYKLCIYVPRFLQRNDAVTKSAFSSRI